MTVEPIPYVVVDADGAVVNVVLWDAVTEWHPGEGLLAIPETEYRAAQKQ
jgi:hypothetical protein